MMHRIGRWTVILGILLTAIGLIAGFTAMFVDADGMAVNFLMLVPLGFAALLTGVTITQLHRDSSDN